MTGDLITALTAALNHKAMIGREFRSPMAAIIQPDATAWAILALWASGVADIDLQPARIRLAADQQADGRISVSPEHPEAFWPTSLAILAWDQVPEFRENRNRACPISFKDYRLSFSQGKGCCLCP